MPLPLRVRLLILGCTLTAHAAAESVWQCPTERMPWESRMGAVAFPGTVEGPAILAGGQSGTGVLNDVWSTHDGTAWTRRTTRARWSAREAAAGVVAADGTLILVGGSPSPGQALNDVF